MVRFTGTGAGWDTADDAYISFDLLNITGGDIDDTWDAGDFTACEALFTTFLTAMKPYYVTHVKASEFRWYRREFNAPAVEKPFAVSGPPVKIQTMNIPGSAASGGLAPQSALSITERTPWPRHWGRFYFPYLAADMMTVGANQYTTAKIGTIAALVQTLYAGLADAEYFPVVPVTQIDKVPVRGLLGVNKIQIDSIPDVVRRRRPKTATNKQLLPVTTP